MKNVPALPSVGYFGTRREALKNSFFCNFFNLLKNFLIESIAHVYLLEKNNFALDRT